MQYRRLGNSNLKVSALCVGSMMFGDQTDLTEAKRIVASAREHGINFIDTADVYTKGASEKMVGELLKKNRHEWVLASKLGNRMSDAVNDPLFASLDNARTRQQPDAPVDRPPRYSVLASRFPR